MPTTTKNKLIRNLVAENIRSEGRTPNTSVLDNTKYQSVIFTKLIDEANEVVESQNDLSHLPEELADVLEVVDAIIKFRGLSYDQVKQLQKDKRDKWGGFDQKIWLESVTEKD